MIDWHSHVLPQLDDGSRSLEESVAMLEALKCQGVDTVIATPHFYANEESVEAFLERRKKSHDLLSSEIKSDDVVAVIGSGPVGLCAMASARVMRAKKIIAIDVKNFITIFRSFHSFFN